MAERKTNKKRTTSKRSSSRSTEEKSKTPFKPNRADRRGSGRTDTKKPFSPYKKDRRSTRNDRTGEGEEGSSFTRPTDGKKKFASKIKWTRSSYAKAMEDESANAKPSDAKASFSAKATADRLDGMASTYAKVPVDRSEDENKKRHDSKSKRRSEHDGKIRLNKVVANTGLCSRREADEFIRMGLISVNGKVVTEMGVRVSLSDTIRHEKKILNQEKMVYLLLNKPKDFITTTSDTHGRKTVMDIVGGACRERIYPVGRLDRATTGLLLFTNDGELAKKLTHPRYNIRKMYHVYLDKSISLADVKKLTKGIRLKDGLVKADDATHVEGGKKNEIGITLHSGKNRVVRRMLESLGYKVTKLDRVAFAGLSKKDVPRGRYRFLTPEEVTFLRRTK
ncbi:MAG: rRNA pseudouridine synthase [Bacteroidetes bacterium]|nr:rRNA pseudouridine synthase [Bacteroidota bacterium]